MTQPVPSARLLAHAGRQQLRLFAAALMAANLLLPVGLILYAHATDRDYATLFWGERNAVTWFSSLQLLFIALVAYANHETIGLLRRLELDDTSARRWLWLLFTAGFVFLALDERFEFHEYLRDEVLRPRDLFVVPFLRKSDVSMYFYLLVGLALGWLLLGELRARRLSLGLFALGVGVAVASVLIDTLDKSLTRQLPFPNFWTSVFEEVGELWAQMFFAMSFLVLLDDRLTRLTGSPASEA